MPRSLLKTRTLWVLFFAVFSEGTLIAGDDSPPPNAPSDSVEQLLHSVFDCSHTLQRELHLKSAGTEGWAVQVDKMDGGKTQLLTRVFLRDKDNRQLARLNTVRLLVGSPTHQLTQVDLVGNSITELVFQPGVEVSDAQLAELYKSFIYAETRK